MPLSDHEAGLWNRRRETLTYRYVSWPICDYSSRATAISGHLLNQRIKAIELHLRSQVFDERDRQVGTVKIPIKVKDMGFEVGRICAEHRSHAYRGGTCITALMRSVEHIDTYSIDPEFRWMKIRDRHVGGGKP